MSYRVFVFICTMLFQISDIYGTLYTVYNATNKFTEFKARYNKVYNNSDEEKKHYLAFVNNLNAAAALNATSLGKTIYLMNKYADLDPEEVEETYAIHLKTYDAVKKGKHHTLLRSDHGIEVNDNNLYNLQNPVDVLEKYIQEENRQFSGKRDGFVNFYKFVKTLAEKNRVIYEGNDPPDVDQRPWGTYRVDILTESDEFFY